MTIPLRDAILAALPGTMAELAQRVGRTNMGIKAEVQAMKWDGLLHRRPGAIYHPGPAPSRGKASQVGESALPAPRGGHGRKRAWVLLAIPGWPHQDPGRAMPYLPFESGQDAVIACQRLRLEHKNWKFTAAMLRDSDVWAMKQQTKQGPHPARA